MSVAIITGSSGLIGSETAKSFHEKGLDIVGIDNNMRQYFFGQDGSISWNTDKLINSLDRFKHNDIDIRNEDAIEKVFASYGKNIEMIVHTAAQPSHDWAAKEPLTDFSINAVGTINLLECTRKHCPEASFIFTSTNKVYGDTPNKLPLKETETRWELSEDHEFSEFGIDESMSIDHSKHSIFGASKAAADLMVQEYGRYFGVKTVSFRGGCLTGPSHSGAELHGFLAYLVKCAIIGKKYNIYGYKGKQVRDNIHSEDLVSCFWEYHKNPRCGAVYNMGGSRHSNCSILEAIDMIEEFCGKRVEFSVTDQNRIGDHIWYISDVRAFQADYPEWKYKYSIKDILSEIISASEERYGKS
ncbi:MAG: NAD-dependent epimerase/dehydratase family protein [Oligoflexales bacterium]|nr:NAD-dependent epimerase/dehydratase family protein [Oligoflexales bacterium]